MKAIRNAAVGVLFLSSYALAASQIAFTLNLQDGGVGSQYAAYVNSWKNPASCDPIAFPQLSATSFNAGSIITWDARVAVSGTHSNGFVPSGVANIVFNLELQQESSPGSGVWTTVPFPVSTGANVAGWFSRINDGTTGTRQTSCGKPADDVKLAAACVSYNLNSKHGRVIDLPTDGGPYVDYYQYPSAAGFPTGSTAPTGKLLGCGAGYSKYNSVANPGGLNTAGVGVASGSASCAAALGTSSVFEGQMNTTGLVAGSYRLVLTPGSGCNILDGSFNCTGADPGKFALKPDLASQGATLNFTLAGVVTPVTLSNWRSLKTHSGAGEVAIALNAAATATGTTAGGIKVESRFSTAQNGLTKIQVDVSGVVTVADANLVTITGLSTSGCDTAGNGCTSSAKAVTPTITMAAPQTLQLAFASGTAASESCYIIAIQDGALSAPISGDRDCKVRVLYGDASGDGLVNIGDLSYIKFRLDQPITSANASCDVNLAAGINLGDLSSAKFRIGRRALCP